MDGIGGQPRLGQLRRHGAAAQSAGDGREPEEREQPGDHAQQPARHPGRTRRQGRTRRPRQRESERVAGEPQHRHVGQEEWPEGDRHRVDDEGVAEVEQRARPDLQPAQRAAGGPGGAGHQTDQRQQVAEVLTAGLQRPTGGRGGIGPRGEQAQQAGEQGEGGDRCGAPQQWTREQRTGGQRRGGQRRGGQRRGGQCRRGQCRRGQCRRGQRSLHRADPSPESPRTAVTRVVRLAVSAAWSTAVAASSDENRSFRSVPASSTRAWPASVRVSSTRRP